MNKKVSVIVPAYNVEEYIENCIISIIQQTYTNIEIIIIDDGSTDSTGKICDRLAKADKRINVIHQKNQGLSQARNNGIKLASGEYISLIDGDDIVKKDFLRNMADAMKDNVDVVVGGYKTVADTKKILCINKMSNSTLSGKDATIRLLTKQEDFFVIAWNKLYKRELFTKNNIWYPAKRIHEDNLTTYKLLSKARNVTIIDSSDYLYIKRAGSITDKSKKDLQVQEKINAANEAIEYFPSGDLHDAAKYSLFLTQIIKLNEAIRAKNNNYAELINDILKNKPSENKFCAAKQRIYTTMLRTFSGEPYIAFRKLIDKLS